ncbi:unnamed protein product [Sphagnum troendelagicum]|uniref:Uncharacterized protein n=1 Tax=Sphagnum troendelagicum TaxID=128251 RepID=A0ABP0TN31_9BRYO
MVIFKNSKLFWNIFDLNFQAGADPHSEDDQAPTLNSYASEHEIPIEWQGHFLENALPAFHEGRTSLHMAASNGQVAGKDSSGMAPMDSAVQAAAYTMVLMLQSYLKQLGCMDHQGIYANAANAILVGAALLASVT